MKIEEGKGCAVEGFELAEVDHFSWGGFWLVGILTTFVAFVLTALVIQGMIDLQGIDKETIKPEVYNGVVGISATLGLVGGGVGGFVVKNKKWEFVKISDKKEVITLTPDKSYDSGYKTRVEKR